MNLVIQLIMNDADGLIKFAELDKNKFESSINIS